MISNKSRSNALSALKCISKNKDVITKIEAEIFRQTGNENTYNNVLYQTIGDLINNQQNIIEELKEGRIGRNHHFFKETENKLIEQQSFLENPFEVEVGILQCRQCGSKRVFSYQKQDRSSDEGTSTYAQCTECKSKWVFKG